MVKCSAVTLDDLITPLTLNHSPPIEMNLLHLANLMMTFAGEYNELHFNSFSVLIIREKGC